MVNQKQTDSSSAERSARHVGESAQKPVAAESRIGPESDVRGIEAGSMRSFDSDHPYRSLPRSPDLGHLRDEAKALKRICASGDPTAIAFGYWNADVRPAVLVAAAQLLQPQRNSRRRRLGLEYLCSTEFKSPWPAHCRSVRYQN
jgi:hypothetical protein